MGQKKPRKWFRWPVWAFTAGLVSALGACSRTPATGPSQAQSVGETSSDAVFEDASAASGLDFTYFNGMSGEYFFCEVLGGGGALLDYDRDGDLDVFLVQGHMLGQDKPFLFPAPPGEPLKGRLFRNDLAIQEDGTPAPRFTDVTSQSGIETRGYGMGATSADYNHDGFPDLYVTHFGANQLFKNNGDGSFTDVTEAAGASEARWSVSAAFLDFDGDGWLDLYIGNYVDFQLEINIACFANVRDYCNPLAYPAVPDRLLRNRGDGTFEDVSAAGGILQAGGRALGVIAADFNGDDWLDIFVANDGTANQLWLNQGDGSFRDGALLAGCGLNEMGAPEAGMGVDAGDYDADGDEDLFITHNRGETNTLYRNDGSGFFEDLTNFSGLGPPSQPFSGFGTAWLDYDNDGWLDLLAVNGAVTKIDALMRAGDPFPFHQRNQLFRNLGDGRFEEVSQRAGKVFEESAVSRGALFGDVDNDGDVDVLVTNINGPARLLLNRVGNRNPWLGLRLFHPEWNRDALGARVAVYRAEGPVLWRRAHADGSYAVSNDPRVLVGLGSGAEVAKVRIFWPGGLIEDWFQPALNQYTTLVRGRGQRVERPE